MSWTTRMRKLVTPERCVAVQRGIVQTYVAAVGPRRARKYLRHVDPDVAALAPPAVERNRTPIGTVGAWLVGLLMGFWLGLAMGLVGQQLRDEVQHLGGVERLLDLPTRPPEAPTTREEQKEDRGHALAL